MPWLVRDSSLASVIYYPFFLSLYFHYTQAHIKTQALFCTFFVIFFVTEVDEPVNKPVTACRLFLDGDTLDTAAEHF